ncbi:MAG TPA: 2-oxoacid:acceptor oxidoreductase family protein [Candidatus Saccharimonadales bacterium]|nr:2-oxoacid:acceptor oxidoreductase family protein [Candidatus Saccharimonadales bacterium]
MDEYQVIESKSPAFYSKYERKSELQHQTHYCPGCGHGVVHKLIAEAITDMGLQDRSIFVSPVGCSVFAYYYFDVGNVQAAHGRASAVATAVKRANPGSLVISYQGDGDLAAIGTAEIIHAANRGEKITVFFVNNAIYGMTGGQMAPTTLVGQTSTTSPWGRRPSNEGYPLHMAELLSTLEAPAYIERVSLHDNKNIMKSRKAVRKALELQRDGAGFTFVEVLSPCPTIWKMTPQEARKWIEEKMLSVFPLGVYRDRRPTPANDAVPQISVSKLFTLDTPEVEPAEPLPSDEPHPDLRINIAGFGGQGVLLLGQILAEMGMRAKRQVSWLPSYGPEMRSGSAHCYVCLCNERVGSPLVEHPDVLIAMNEVSLNKFAKLVGPHGTILYNATELPAGFPAQEAMIYCVPAAEIADKLGTTKATNMVMLGALLELTHTLPKESAFALLKAKVKNAKLLEVDCQAIDAGIECLRKQREAHAESMRTTENELTHTR